jgi:hypothetical protein
VELIVEKSTWEPPKPQWQATTLVALQVAAQEREVRQQVKAAGGQWNPKEMVWELSYGQVVVLGLTARIVTKREEREREAHLYCPREGIAVLETGRLSSAKVRA